MNMTKQAYGTEAYSIAGGGELLVARTAAKDVVSIEGSVLGGVTHVPGHWDIVPALSAQLLDAGTRKKDKNVIRGSLANRGISLSFNSAGDRTYFSGQCLPEDLPFLLSVIVECLGESSFPDREVESEKSRTLGAIAEMKTDTTVQAGIALVRALYDAEHTNFSRTLEEQEASVQKTDRTRLMDFRRRLGRDGLILTIVGDVHAKSVRAAAEKAFSKLPERGLAAVAKPANKKGSTNSEKYIPIADKTNVDVLLGAALPLRKSDQLFLPVSLLADMLGGGFASHLMQTIRERDGLTYGIYADLRGFGNGADGYLRIWATFSPEMFAKSVEALRKEMRHFFAHGMTETALARKKEEITGAYLVGLSTTRGLARALHQLTIDGRDLSYLAKYPDYVRAVPLAEVRTAADLIRLDKLAFVASGTFLEK